MIKRIFLIIIIMFFAGCSSTAISVVDAESFENVTLETSAQSDFYLEVAEQKYNDYSYIHKFGRNDDIDSTSGFEAIWNGGGDYTGFPEESETLEIRSTDGDDTYGGAGAWTVTVKGLLNSTFHAQPDVTVNLSGTSWVTIDSNLYHRASRLSVIKAGSSDAVNEGDLILRQTTTTANVMARVPAGYGQTMIAATTIPAGEKAFLNSWYASMGNKERGVATIRLLMRAPEQAWQVKEEFSILADGSSYVLRQYKVPKNNIEPGTDIKVMADSNTNNLGVAAGMDFILETED